MRTHHGIFGTATERLLVAAGLVAVLLILGGPVSALPIGAAAGSTAGEKPPVGYVCPWPGAEVSLDGRPANSAATCMLREGQVLAVKGRRAQAYVLHRGAQQLYSLRDGDTVRVVADGLIAGNGKRVDPVGLGDGLDKQLLALALAPDSERTRMSIAHDATARGADGLGLTELAPVGSTPVPAEGSILFTWGDARPSKGGPLLIICWPADQEQPASGWAQATNGSFKFEASELEVGRDYAWQLAPPQGGARSAITYFRILPPGEEAALDAALEQVRSDRKKSPLRALLVGEALRHDGRLEDAVHEYPPEVLGGPKGGSPVAALPVWSKAISAAAPLDVPSTHTKERGRGAT